MSIRIYKNIVVTITLALSAALSVFGLEFCILGGVACLLKMHVLWGIARFVLAGPVLFAALFLFLMADHGRTSQVSDTGYRQEKRG